MSSSRTPHDSDHAPPHAVDDAIPPTTHTLHAITRHTCSNHALTFTFRLGAYLLSAGLDGRLLSFVDTTPSHTGTSWAPLASTREVDEINWLSACPSPSHPNTVALGASDGSVWVY